MGGSQPCPRCDGDTAAPTAFEHVGDGGLVAIMHAIDIDFERLVKYFGCDVEIGRFFAKDTGATH